MDILSEPSPLYRRLAAELLRARRVSQTGGASFPHRNDVLQIIKINAGPRSRPFRRPTATYGRDYQTNNTSDYAHIYDAIENIWVSIN